MTLKPDPSDALVDYPRKVLGATVMFRCRRSFNTLALTETAVSQGFSNASAANHKKIGSIEAICRSLPFKYRGIEKHGTEQCPLNRRQVISPYNDIISATIDGTCISLIRILL